MFLQIAHVRLPTEEPEEFIDDGLQVELLGGQAGKPLREVEAHLVTKDADRPCPRAVALLDTFGENAIQ